MAKSTQACASKRSCVGAQTLTILRHTCTPQSLEPRRIKMFPSALPPFTAIPRSLGNVKDQTVVCVPKTATCPATPVRAFVLVLPASRCDHLMGGVERCLRPCQSSRIAPFAASPAIRACNVLSSRSSGKESASPPQP